MGYNPLSFIIIQLPAQKEVQPTKVNCNSLDLGCTTPQITVDYEGIPMWWRHVGILLSKMPIALLDVVG